MPERASQGNRLRRRRPGRQPDRWQQSKTTYVRNVLEQPVEVIDLLERKTGQTFDAGGNLETRTDPEGRTTTYSYDQRQLNKNFVHLPPEISRSLAG